MKNHQRLYSIGFFIATSIFAFAIDISMQLFFAKQFLYLVLICTIWHMITYENFFKIIFLTLLLCAESLFFAGTSLLPLVYLPPITIGIYYAKQRFDGGILFSTLLSSSAILIALITTSLWTLSVPPIHYTIISLCVNLIIIGIGSLKFNTLSEQGNRL